MKQPITIMQMIMMVQRGLETIKYLTSNFRIEERYFMDESDPEEYHEIYLPNLRNSVDGIVKYTNDFNDWFLEYWLPKNSRYTEIFREQLLDLYLEVQDAAHPLSILTLAVYLSAISDLLKDRMKK